MNKNGPMFSILTIRQKFFGTIVLITFCLISIFYALTSHVIHNTYNHLEKGIVVEDIKRVKATFDAQVENLDTLVSDWAGMNATSLYVIDQTHSFEPSFFKDTFINNAKIDLLLILDTKKKLIHGAVSQKRHKLKEVSPALLNSITSHDNLFDHTPQTLSSMGIVQYGSSNLIVAARPIQSTTSRETIHGTLIFGRILDGEWITQLGNISRILLNFHPIFGDSPDSEKASQSLLISPSPYHVKAYTKDKIHGYTFLNDVSGETVLLLGISLKRDIYQQIDKTLAFLLKTIIFISIIFGLIFFLFIDIIISRRLTAIILDIGEIEKSSKHGGRVRESPLKDELGQLAVSINHMLEANESLEEYKAKGKKLEALTTFAAGATHELATPLSAIAVASGEILYDLMNNMTNEDDLYDDIFLIRQQVDRCKYILNQMAADAGQQLGEKVETFSTETLIEDTLTVFNQKTSQLLEVDNKIADQLIAMPLQSICRVFRGLIRNSIDASEPDKPIYISCAESTTHLLLEIRDNGAGMDEHTLKNALDPFFTTKPPGDNLGLGLYLAQSLASRFGGNLQVSSSLDVGTTVILSFAKEHIYV